jgi:hypothetical protein
LGERGESPVVRGVRIALQLDDPAFPKVRVEAQWLRADHDGGGVHVGDSRHPLVLLDEEGDELVAVVGRAAGHGRSRPRHADDLQEVAARGHPEAGFRA